MAANTSIESNVTGLSVAEEASVGVLPGNPIFQELEPNSYSEFGGSTTLLSRNPINPSRQRKKGLVSDLDASGGFQMDLTQKNMYHLLQGFMFADFRRKGEAKNEPGFTTLTFSVAATNSRITRVGGSLDLTTQFAVGDLVHVTGASEAANNGVFTVSAVAATTLDLDVADGTGTAATLINEGATASIGIVQVGAETTTGDVAVDVTGSRPALTSSTFDFTTLGVIPGEYIFIGGDANNCSFTNAANNGFVRVRSVTANRIEFDKTHQTMVNESNPLTIQIFIGRALKNELGTLVKKRSYQFERTLGKADTTDPAFQSEYLPGSVANELTLNAPTANKVTLDMTFISNDAEQRTGAEGLKTGTRVPIEEADAFNTSSDLANIKLSVFNEGTANATPLFAFSQELTLTINNNVSANKALGVLGAFNTSVGTFEVGGSITAYFASVAAIQAVRQNEDVTLDAHFVKSNAGISIDLPMIALGDARANIEQDQPITIPLATEAATGAKIATELDHTLFFVFFDYLPDLADSDS